MLSFVVVRVLLLRGNMDDYQNELKFCQSHCYSYINMKLNQTLASLQKFGKKLKQTVF